MENTFTRDFFSELHKMKSLWFTTESGWVEKFNDGKKWIEGTLSYISSL
jgi:hypothetical protein